PLPSHPVVGWVVLWWLKMSPTRPTMPIMNEDFDTRGNKGAAGAPACPECGAALRIGSGRMAR
ncbi:hypothetical protein, partial [Kitasatospora sp. NPDC059800]|uniref:hypothetical protein n=1 Tax=Kitasatospora sp. NPDC059800 TaxID=3346951 RepID=UPI003659B784